MTNQEHVTGSFEIHLFAEPPDPPPGAIEGFRAARAVDSGWLEPLS